MYLAICPEEQFKYGPFSTGRAFYALPPLLGAAPLVFKDAGYVSFVGLSYFLAWVVSL
jgi:hypothetical protein